MTYEIRQELTELLGSGHKTSRNNVAFQCPFTYCASHKTEKHKLEVNFDTEQWHCWVCNTRGKSFKSLFYALQKKYSLGEQPVPKSLSLFEEQAVPHSSVSLPKEFKALHGTAPLGFYGKKALAYLYSRGITDDDIVTYNLGFCEEGNYDGYIVIPNYTEQGQLDYFTTRAYIPTKPKTRNPTIERKSVIGFDLQLNWNLPIILVESAFNAITVKYNASPMYGSNMMPGLTQKIYTKEVAEVIFCWDDDAYKKSIAAAMELAANGIKVKVVQFPTGLDANNLGHDKTWELINSTPYKSFTELKYSQLLESL